MKFIINFEKRHFWVLAGLVTILGIGIVVSLQADNIPWHPLQQVSTDATGAISVDSDDDGVIDLANISNNALKLEGQTLQWVLNNAGGAANLPTCSDGQILAFSNGSWQCSDAGGAGGGSRAPDYDSGWFDVQAYTQYEKIHNLGTKEYQVLILYRENSNSGFYTIASHYEQPYRIAWNGARTGAVVLEQRDNSIKIHTGDYLNGIGFTDLDAQYYKQTGQYKILLWKIFGGGTGGGLGMVSVGPETCTGTGCNATATCPAGTHVLYAFLHNGNTEACTPESGGVPTDIAAAATGVGLDDGDCSSESYFGIAAHLIFTRDSNCQSFTVTDSTSSGNTGAGCVRAFCVADNTGGGVGGDVPSGTWCGLCGDGSTNVKPCLGYNVCTGCPPGYTREGWSNYFWMSGTLTDYICVKD